MRSQESVTFSSRTPSMSGLASSSRWAKFPPFHSAGRSRAAGWFQETRVQWKCSLFIWILSRGKTRGQDKAYLELFHFSPGTSIKAISSEHACAVSVFQLEKFYFCIPYLLSPFAERGCKITGADGTFSKTQFYRPREHTTAFSGQGSTELKE